jgi:hypothetical protein
MIVFDLKCSRNHVFEAWFRDSKAFERQAKAGALACAVCGDTRIEKAPMAPNVATRKGGDLSDAEKRKAAAKLMAAMREHVAQNFEPVGERFAEEARRIHYGEVDPKNIVGRATSEEAKELNEEGIEFGVLPFPAGADA